MNCANHSDIAAVAFCRTCGKPLCQTCTRDVRGVIYCESCLAARLDGTAPAAGFVPPAQTVYPPGGPAYVQPGAASSGPNPTVAGILAGFFPIGVGAVYCGQYAKGLSHLVIMVLLILGLGSDLPWYVHHDARRSQPDFSTSTRSSMRCAPRKRFRWENLLPIRSGWRRRLVPDEKFAKERKIPVRCGDPDRPRRAVPAAYSRLVRVRTRSFLAADPDRPRCMAVRQAVGTDQHQPSIVSVRTLPNSQLYGSGDAGHAGRSVPAGQRLAHRIRQNVAGHPAGDRRGEADAEQRILWTVTSDRCLLVPLVFRHRARHR